MTMNVGDHEVRVIRDAGPERARSELAIGAAGFPLPLAHRLEWAAMRTPAGSWFFDVRDRAGGTRGGFAAEVHRSRVLPGHLILRVERFGAGLAPDAIAAAVNALVQVARNNCRVLRIHVEQFSTDPAVKSALESVLSSCRFSRMPETRRYPRTIRVDCSGSEESIFASLHGTARRHIRAIAKHPVEIRPIADATWSPRMDELVRETMERTGGGHRFFDWPRQIEFTKHNSQLAYLLGLFRKDISGPPSLLAFAWSCLNGDYAHYDTAASTRATDLKLPLNYALAWELIRWAKQNGATWFDFGGITAGSHGDASDRLGGISDFKRYFSTDVIDVGGEWVLEPRWPQSRLAHALSSLAGWASSLKSKLRPGPAAKPAVEHA
jgi:hypothetical protein